MSSAVKGASGSTNRTAARSAKCRARAGMSSGRSRSGGRRMGKTAIRYQRSSRNCPSATIAARSRWVAATRRTLTWTGSCPPTRSIQPSWRIRSRRTWAAKGSSPTSSSSKRPAVGPLEPPLPRLHRAGKGPAFVAEELRVDQLRRDRSAVHAQERAAGPRRLGVEHPRDEFLARARLAQDQNGRVVAGHQGHPLDDVLKS